MQRSSKRLTHTDITGILQATMSYLVCVVSTYAVITIGTHYARIISGIIRRIQSKENLEIMDRVCMYMYVYVPMQVFTFIILNPQSNS